MANRSNKTEQPATSPSKPPVAKRRAGRPAQITREQIIDAALSFGSAEVRLSQVAKKLNVSVPALYRHVRSADDLLNEMADRLFQAFPVPVDTGQDWNDWAFDFGVMLRDFYNAIPGMAAYGLARTPRNFKSLVRYEKSITVATRNGVPLDEALIATRAIVDFVLGHITRQEKQSHIAEETGGIAHDEALLAHIASRDRIEREQLQNFVTALQNLNTKDPADVFRQQLRGIVDGQWNAFSRNIQ